MYRSFLAYKYVFRLITLMALLGVTYSVTVLIVVVSVMEGFRSELENRVRRMTSDLRVESNLFVGLEDAARVEALLEQTEGIEEASPIVETLALCRRVHPFPSDTATDRMLIGLDIDDAMSRDELDRYVGAFQPPDPPFPRPARDLAAELPKTVAEIFSESWTDEGLRNAISRHYPRLLLAPRADDELVPCLVGSESLPGDLLLPGSRLELTSFSPVTQEVRTGQFLVVGYVKTGLYEVDSKGIVLRLDDADRFLGLSGDDGKRQVSAVRTRVSEAYDNEASLIELREGVEKSLDAAGVYFVKTQTWREARRALLQAVQMEKFIVSLILGVVILFAGFMIFIILTVQVIERRPRHRGPEFTGGRPARGIASIYFIIGFSLCLAGTVLGTIYGVSFSFYVNTIQRWIKLLTGLEIFPEDVYYLDHIPVKFNPSDLLFIIVPTVAASLIASLIPALRAARKDPVVSLSQQVDTTTRPTALELRCERDRTRRLVRTLVLPHGYFESLDDRRSELLGAERSTQIASRLAVRDGASVGRLNA